MISCTRSHWLLDGIFVLFLSIASGSTANALDFSTVDVSLFYEPGAQLTGQSAFIETRVGGSAGSEILNGVTNAGATIEFENGPESSLTNYLNFSYVGIYHRLLFDEFGVPIRDESGNQIVDRSLVIGFDNRNLALGRRLDELFPSIGYDESTVVDAMTNQVDSPEFLDLAYNRVANRVATRSPIGLFETTCFSESSCLFPTQVRATGDLYLIAFIGGANGDLGDDIGVVTYSIERITMVPEPGTATLLALGLVGMAASRRRGNAKASH